MTSATLRRGDRGRDVRELQRTLVGHGFRVSVDGIFGAGTQNAVKAFQSQNLDKRGQPLTVDGVAGPSTWWSLTHPKPQIEQPDGLDYQRMPPEAAGGSAPGRAALQIAIEEMRLGAREQGGNNRGAFIRKYLAPAHGVEGSNWCAAFVSWCYLQASGGALDRMPFPYSISARAVLNHGKQVNWAHEPGSAYIPVPGDLVVWWRVRANGWQGHIGLTHHVEDGTLYTIEGNRSPRVQGFSYVVTRMDKLLGFSHVP